MKEAIVLPTISRARITWSYRLKSTFLEADNMANRLADERMTLAHDHPLDQADKIRDLKSSERRYRSLAEVIGGLSRSWDQKVPGREKPYYTLLAKNGFGSNGKTVLTPEELKKAEKVFYRGWILPAGTNLERLKVPVVCSTKLLFAKCPRCGKMQLVVRCFRRKGLFWWLRQKPDFYILCLDCACVYVIHSGIEIIEKTT